MKTVALLFNWPHRHRIHLLLPAMLILAALAHCGIFFLFSVATPPVKSDGLNPARIYFLGEASAELAKLETTLTSNDPALFAPRHSTSASIAFCANYTPQFASSRTALLNLPPQTRKPASPPPASGPVTIPPSRQPMSPRPQSTFHRISSPDLASRLPQTPIENFFPKSTAGSLDAVTFFVGIRADGSLAHIFTDESSGNPALDLQAMQALKSLTFTPDETRPLAWGFVTLHFGKDSTP